MGSGKNPGVSTQQRNDLLNAKENKLTESDMAAKLDFAFKESSPLGGENPLDGTVTINELRNNLMQRSGLSEKEVDAYLYQLYLDKKIDLSPGKGPNQLIGPDGAKFAFASYRDKYAKERKQLNAMTSLGKTTLSKPKHERFSSSESKGLSGRIKQNASESEEAYFQKIRQLSLSVSDSQMTKFDNALKSITNKITTKEKWRGGVVPIAKVRNDLSDAGYTLSEQDTLLIALEKKAIIDLGNASDATLLDDPDSSIWSKNRGAISYITYRR